MTTERYINTSEMTTHVAKGILLYARVQNLPVVYLPGSEAERDWESWKATFPEWVEFVLKEQNDLFNRINAKREEPS